MKFSSAFFLLGLAGVSAQNIVGTEMWGSFYTWDHNYKTNLYSITRLTAPTLPPGQTGYWNGIDKILDWNKRVGLAWYFDRICPCNWGCDGRFCTWCANDNRYPEFWGKGRSLGDVEGVEPSSNMGPLYDCNDNLDTGVIIEMEPAEIDYANYEIDVQTYFVNDIYEPNNTRAYTRAASASAQNWRIQRFTINNIWLQIQQQSPVGTNITGGLWAEGLTIAPVGIKYVQVWWPHTYNMPTAWGARNWVKIHVNTHDIKLPANTAGLAFFTAYKQQIEGHCILDIVTMTLKNQPYLEWKMSIPRANYFVYIRSDDNQGWNYYYPTVNAVLCGGATNPATCRTHEQKGRIVNRVHGDWQGAIAPFVNRTVYDWDMSISDYEERHNRRVLSIDRIPFVNKGADLEIQFTMEIEAEDEPGVIARDGYSYVPEDPMMSYKIY